MLYTPGVSYLHAVTIHRVGDISVTSTARSSTPPVSGSGTMDIHWCRFSKLTAARISGGVIGFCSISHSLIEILVRIAISAAALCCSLSGVAMSQLYKIGGKGKDGRAVGEVGVEDSVPTADGFVSAHEDVAMATVTKVAIARLRGACMVKSRRLTSRPDYLWSPGFPSVWLQACSSPYPGLGLLPFRVQSDTGLPWLSVRVNSGMRRYAARPHRLRRLLDGLFGIVDSLLNVVVFLDRVQILECERVCCSV